MYFIFVLNVLYISLLYFRRSIVIHGGIDGYSRLIVFLRASNNNCSCNVMNCFLNAVARYGVPSRVRTDHGGENNECLCDDEHFQGLRERQCYQRQEHS